MSKRCRKSGVPHPCCDCGSIIRGKQNMRCSSCYHKLQRIREDEGWQLVAEARAMLKPLDDLVRARQ